MKKIAIISPYREYNYGTVLQAYALQKALEKLGVSSEYLNYTTMKPLGLLEKIFKKISSELQKLKAKTNTIDNNLDDYSFFEAPEFKFFVDGFNAFAEQIHESRHRYNPETIPLCTEYEGYMVGSDQTWSIERTKNNSLLFLKDIDDRYPKMSYAPSIGTTHISEEYLRVLKNNLAAFRNISCREKTNCELLSRELGREVSFVLDPTLLLRSDEWNQIAKKPDRGALCTQQYILCYILGEKKKISDFAEAMGLRLSLPVYYIVTRPQYLEKQNHLFVTPESFLGAIRDAHTVITDSFHGSLFSINYNTEFYSFTKRETEDGADNDRILELLNTMGLQDRFIEFSEEETDSRINYSVVNDILETYRKRSWDYLKRCVE
jgi:hypothetical protein